MSARVEPPHQAKEPRNTWGVLTARGRFTMDNDQPASGVGDMLPALIITEPDAYSMDATADGDATDELGFVANFIRQQPVLTLSIAFGLGLLVTSLLARKRS